MGMNSSAYRAVSCRATPGGAARSETVGTPIILTPPPPFGICTAFTSGGKYVPEDIRFQTLYRLSFRSFSNAPIDTPSTPADPLFPLTFTQASHTSCLEMPNGLAEAFSPLIPLLPEHFRLMTTHRPRTTRPLRSAPITMASATTTRSASAPPHGTLPPRPQTLPRHDPPYPPLPLTPRPLSRHAFSRST